MNRLHLNDTEIQFLVMNFTNAIFGLSRGLFLYEMYKCYEDFFIDTLILFMILFMDKPFYLKFTKATENICF